LGKHCYLLALGSNMRHHRHGRPRDVLRAAIASLEDCNVQVGRRSPIIHTAPVGRSRRRFANAAITIQTNLAPPDMLTSLQEIERRFGRRGLGQRWRARVLDLDIVLWSGGTWASPGLVIPHVSFRDRDFVLRPASAIAPDWRDPVSGLTVRNLSSRLTSRRRMPR